MKVAKVIGNIWATRKEEKLAGLKLLLVQPLNVLDGSKDRMPIVAADIIGAGVGETVLVVSGSSARSAAGDMSIPVDATVVGIVDDQEIDMSVVETIG
ncbi:MAG: ethanolamine utilization protein EutN [Clostridia bacterium]|nr:ethanolamine utilization protein EutN [Clostridia bacterium]